MDLDEEYPLTQKPHRLVRQDPQPYKQDFRETMNPPSPSSRTHPLQSTKLPCVLSAAKELRGNSHRRTTLRPIRKVSVTGTTLNNDAKKSSQSQPQSDPAHKPNPPSPTTPFTRLSSLPVKSMLLYDWWLVRVEGKGLAVGGFASRGSIGVRTFSSAAIIKRHDATTLATADGITIIITGFMNRSRTHLNGFPLEVCNHFLLGFPYYWEEYANKSSGQECCDNGVQTKISCFAESNMSSGSCTNTPQPLCLDEIPVTRTRDFFISSQTNDGNGCLVQELCDEVLRHCGSGSVEDESASKQKQKKSSGRSRMDTKAFAPGRRIVTRSMSRLKNLEMEGNPHKSTIRRSSRLGNHEKPIGMTNPY